MMIRRIRAALVLAGLLALALPLAPAREPVDASAGQNSCPALVARAFDTAETACAGTGTNQACYGHLVLDAQPQPGISSFQFAREGDIVNVADVRSLRLSPMDPVTGVWGVALMKLQAGTRGPAAESATLLLFGDVELESAFVAPTSRLEMAANATSNINVRQEPGLNAAVIATLRPGDAATAIGRLADNSWVQVELPGTGQIGWVYGPLLTSEGDLTTLDVVERPLPYYGPMKAFYFRSGGNDALCPEAPDSGLLIQTPEGIAKVSLLINEITVELGSTVLFRTESGGEMAVTVVEGAARVTAMGQTQTAPAGAEIRVPLGGDGQAAGPPSPPQPYTETAVQSLPVSHLERPVEIHPPLTEAEIEALTATPDAVLTPAATEAAISPTEDAMDGELLPGIVDNPGLDGAVPPGLGGGGAPGLQDGGGLETETPPPGAGEGPGRDDGPPPATEDSTGPVTETPPGTEESPGPGGDLPPGLQDNPGFGDNLPPPFGGEPPGQAKKD